MERRTTVVVTGGGGFIGRHLVSQLQDTVNAVVVVDVKPQPGCASELGGTVHWVTGDICQSETWRKTEAVCRDAAGNQLWIFHLACPASPVEYSQHPLATLQVCSTGTWRALEFAQRHGARFLFSSTSEVYGDPIDHPQAEGSYGRVPLTTAPRSCYDNGKRFAEVLVRTWSRQHQLDVRVARLFNCYGPGMNLNDGRVVPSMISRMLEDKPILVYGSGVQTRSLCFVEDAVNAMMALMSSPVRPSGSPQWWDLPVNIGNPQEEIPILTLADQLRRVAGRPDHTIRLIDNEFAHDPARRCPDITRAMMLLQWRPTTCLSDGLRRCIQHFRACSLPQHPEEL